MLQRIKSPQRCCWIFQIKASQSWCLSSGCIAFCVPAHRMIGSQHHTNRCLCALGTVWTHRLASRKWGWIYRASLPIWGRTKVTLGLYLHVYFCYRANDFFRFWYTVRGTDIKSLKWRLQFVGLQDQDKKATIYRIAFLIHVLLYHSESFPICKSFFLSWNTKENIT